MEGTVYVHIGAPKTGSTALQCFLDRNRDRLRGEGYLYPAAAARAGGHHDLSFLLNDAYPDWAIGQDATLDELTGRLETECAGFDGDVILSSENFYLLNTPDQVRRLLDSVPALKSRRAVIVVFLRRQDEAHEAWYNQTIKAQGATHSLRRCIKRNLDLWDYGPRLSEWADVFCASHILPAIYSSGTGWDIRSHFLDMLGIAAEGFDLDAPRVNSRLSPGFLAVQRAINWLPIPVTAKRRFHKRFIKGSARFLGGGSAGSGTPAWKAEVMERYAAGNLVVADRFFGGRPLFGEAAAGDGRTDREAVEGSGLFDAEFYRDAYADYLRDGQDPLDHFLRIGGREGCLASPRFDPCIYKLNVPSAREADNPLAHAARAGSEFLSAGNHSPCLDGVSFSLLRPRDPKGVNLLECNAVTPEQARTFSGPSSITFEAGGRSYTLESPPSEFLLTTIRENKPFGFMRRPEGGWDFLATIGKMAKDIEERGGDGLSEPERLRLALRIANRATLCEGKWADMFRYWNQVLAENFWLEIIEDMRAPRSGSNLVQAVAFKGYPTLENRLFVFPGADPAADPNIPRVLDTFAEYYPDASTPLFDATYMKRGVVSGGFAALPEVCREHPVLLIGPPWCGSIGQRWGLTRFRHLSIPWHGAVGARHALLARCREALESLPRNDSALPVFLFQCGGCVAAWLMTRLERDFPDCIYLDMGQSVDAWCLDESFSSMFPWVRIFRESMVRNLGLEYLYRDACGTHYPDWLGWTDLYDGECGPKNG
ncbi:MAG: hypothetical protein AB7E51_05460 [Pseudodesulfovibrio sp.]|uniref:hypothetical protein n=1 Tax=Pseudodesulfovibrio sp. TaxID=2035812 RepID=UPI003D151CBE